ncbi:MAG: hydantoinase B/oxoprolinase family protein [Nitrososphaerota archaeon]
MSRKGIIAEIVRSYLNSVAEEMRRTLIRTAFNPVIYDVLDFGISLYDTELRLVAEAPGLPFFIGANDYAIVKAVEYIGEQNLESGDIVLMNYPYWNSAHTLDVTTFAPVFHSNSSRPVAYLVIRAHWMDLGAKDAGYVLDSTDLHQEGIIFPGTKVCKGGRLDKEILELIRFNSRMPDLVIGDLHSQIASIKTGEKRIISIIEKFGLDTVRESIDIILQGGENKCRSALRALPHGEWSAEDYIDDDGVTSQMIPIRATVKISDDIFQVDFTGSSPMVKGPVNMPFGATYSICRMIFKSLTTPEEPSNAGHFAPLRVVAPPGSIFHAVYPSATFTLWTGMLQLELVFKALGKGLPDLISASSGGDVPGFMMVGIHPDNGKLYALSNNEPVGWGACSTHDGANALQHRSSAVVRNTPIEVLESRTAMIIERLELITDSGAPGKFRGGLGVLREIKFTSDGELISVMKKTKTKPWGLNGGWDAEPTSLLLYAGSFQEKKVGTYRAKVKKGDKCVLKTAGGGGWGKPSERDPEAVLEDVLDGYVSIECAESIYGVAIRDGRIDWERTRKIRANEQ